MTDFGGQSARAQSSRTYLPSLAIGLLYLMTAVVLAPGAVSDWTYADLGSRLLFSSDAFRLYHDHPEIQMGPLALLAARGCRTFGSHAPLAATVLSALLVVPVLTARSRAVSSTQSRWTVPAVAAILLLPWTELAVRTHLDDALAVVLLSLAARAADGNRPVLSGSLVAAAIASKPWAVIGIAMLLLLPDRRGQVRAVGTAAVLSLAVWLPFLLSGGSASARVVHAIGPASLLSLVGGDVGSSVPDWYRIAQLAVAAGVTASVVMRRRGTGLTSGLTLRTALEPAVITYHTSVVTAFAAVDDVRSATAVPIRTVLAATLWAVTLGHPGTSGGVLRLLLILGLVVMDWVTQPFPRHGAPSEEHSVGPP